MKIPKHSFGDEEDESIPPEIHAMLSQVVSIATVAGIVSTAARLEAFLRAAAEAGLIQIRCKNVKTSTELSHLGLELLTRLNEAGYALHGDVSHLESPGKPVGKNIKLPHQNHPHRN